jgi:hypothetical protein
MQIAPINRCQNGTHPSTDYCYPADLDQLDRYGTATIIFLAIYMLFANVLLLNMLIAIFT